MTFCLCGNVDIRYWLSSRVPYTLLISRVFFGFNGRRECVRVRVIKVRVRVRVFVVRAQVQKTELELELELELEWCEYYY